ncbi:MAG: tetratricopeptide repeat protein [Polyangiaceae bacterium]|nr:tetratricopeptide repeat protein [Polyangiaceae bacterium]
MTDRNLTPPPDGAEAEASPASIRPEELLDALLSDDNSGDRASAPPPLGHHHLSIAASGPPPRIEGAPVSIGRPPDLARPAPRSDDEIDALLEAALPSIHPPSAPEDLPVVEQPPHTPTPQAWSGPVSSFDPSTLSANAQAKANEERAFPGQPDAPGDEWGPESFAEEALTLRRTSKPPPLPRNIPRTLEGERSAALHINASGMLEQWAERAAWLEQQAQVTKDPKARARLLVVASELCAMVGDFARGGQLATAAAEASASASVASRQVRWFAAQRGDWKKVSDELERELRAGEGAETRAHASYFSSEIQRLKLGDDGQHSRKVELLSKLKPTDPRCLLNAFLENVEAPKTSPETWPESDGLSELKHAAQHMLRARGTGANHTWQHVPMSVAFQQASRAMRDRQTGEVVKNLEPIAQSKGLKGATLWLRAMLLSHRAETRGQALEHLEELAKRKESALVTRALVAGNVEAGQFEHVLQLIGEARGERALSLEERTALYALLGAALGKGRDLISESLHSRESLPLFAAVTATASDIPPEERAYAGDHEAIWQARLAHALADTSALSATEPLTALSEALRYRGAPASAKSLIAALQLELKHRNRDAQGLADQLREEAKDPSGPSARLLTAALLYEAHGLTSDALVCYTEALRRNADNEGIARVLLEGKPAELQAQLLLSVAEATEDPVRRALLLTESSLHLGNEHRDYQKTLKEAFEAEPSLPFAEDLRFRDARRRNEEVVLGDLFREVRRHRSTPREQALLLLRECWHVAQTAPDVARSLLEQAIDLGQKDLATALFLERWSALELRERAELRQLFAAQLPAEDARTLGFSSALIYAALGERDKAVECLGGPDEPLGRFIHDLNLREGRGLDEYIRASQAALEAGPADRLPILNERARLLSLQDRNEESLREYRAILSLVPRHIPALYAVRRSAVAEREPWIELARISEVLAAELDGHTGLAYAWLAAHLGVVSDQPERSEAATTFAHGQLSPPLWAQRKLYTQALGRDAERTLTLSYPLIERAENPLDRATLTLRAAEATMALERYPTALALINQGLEAVGEHWVLLMRKADLTERLGDYSASARAWEALGAASSSPEQQRRAFRRAAMVWQDHVDDKPRAIESLRRALDIDPRDDDTFTRLLALYRETNQLANVVNLLEQRLAITSDLEVRLPLEVDRCRTLIGLGEHALAREGLSRVLELSPNHAEALTAFADLSVQACDFTAAEQAWLRVVRQLVDPLKQTEIYLRLGHLYSAELPNPERAEVAFNEVLKRNPDDARALQALAQVYSKLGQTDRAIKLATQLLEHATTDDEKRNRTVELALLQEHAAQEPKKAQATLERARRQWPQDGDVLSALVGVYRRAGQTDLSDKALQTALADARRAVSAGRFDPSFFQLLRKAAELKQDLALGEAAEATLSGLIGGSFALRGVGLGALDSAFDDLLAPEIFTQGFRTLLAQTHQILELAYPLDAHTLRAEPFGSTELSLEEEVVEISAQLGLPTPTILASPVLGAVCIPTLGAGPLLIVGKSLALSEPTVRTFVITRSLKLLMAHTSVLTRLAAIELGPILAALLNLLSPQVHPINVDAAKLASARAKLTPYMLPASPELADLAAQVAQTLGNRANQLGILAQQWASRAALLAYGNVNTAMEAIALSSGQHSLRDLDREARVRFLMRHNEARELAVFSLSDDYTLARSRL